MRPKPFTVRAPTEMPFLSRLVLPELAQSYPLDFRDIDESRNQYAINQSHQTP